MLAQSICGKWVRRGLARFGTVLPRAAFCPFVACGIAPEFAKNPHVLTICYIQCNFRSLQDFEVIRFVAALAWSKR